MNDLEGSVIEGVESEPALDEKEALRQSIERNEAELRDAVEELTAAVKNDITLGAHITEHPWAWLAGGFVAGLLLSRR